MWVLRRPTCREPTSVAGATVEGFPHEVEVAGVAGGFLEQVDEDPAQAHMAVKVGGACGELVEGGRGVGDLTRVRALVPVHGNDRVDRVVWGDSERLRT